MSQFSTVFDFRGYTEGYTAQRGREHRIECARRRAPDTRLHREAARPRSHATAARALRLVLLCAALAAGALAGCNGGVDFGITSVVADHAMLVDMTTPADDLAETVDGGVPVRHVAARQRLLP